MSSIQQSIPVSRYHFGVAQNTPERRVACALDGCEVPVVQRSGGGRPRLYCSDSHRAEARRHRLRSAQTPAEGGTPVSAGDGELEKVCTLLRAALAGVERARTAAPRDEALVAAARAEATAEVLRAQQVAADAARHAAAARDQLAREQGEWQSALEEVSRDRAEHARALEELSGALDGARAELEHELLGHHEDAERAESILQAQRAAHAADVEQLSAELDELRRRLAGALGAADQAEEHALRAQQLVAERSTATLALEVRVARAEEQARQATARLEEAREELARLRTELATERRHHRAVETELRRRDAQPSVSGDATTRSRRRSSQTPAAAARVSASR